MLDTGQPINDPPMGLALTDPDAESIDYPGESDPSDPDGG